MKGVLFVDYSILSKMVCKGVRGWTPGGNDLTDLSNTLHQFAILQCDGWCWFGEGALQHHPSSIRYNPSLWPLLSFLYIPFKYSVEWLHLDQPLLSNECHQSTFLQWLASTARRNTPNNTARLTKGFQDVADMALKYIYLARYIGLKAKPPFLYLS